MNDRNLKLFWIACFVSVIVAIYWSAISMLRQPKPLYTAFLIINLTALVVNVICFVIDRNKNKPSERR